MEGSATVNEVAKSGVEAERLTIWVGQPSNYEGVIARYK